MSRYDDRGRLRGVRRCRYPPLVTRANYSARARARGGERLNGARVDGLNGLVARLQRFETVRIAAAPDCQ